MTLTQNDLATFKLSLAYFFKRDKQNSQAQ